MNLNEHYALYKAVRNSAFFLKRFKPNIRAFHFIVNDDFFSQPESHFEKNVLKEGKSRKPRNNSAKKSSNTEFKNRDCVSSNDPRFNSIGIQMLSSSLHKQIFGCDIDNTKDDKLVTSSIDELKKFGLFETLKTLPDVNFKLPTLEGQTIEDHFRIIGEEQSGPYKSILLKLIESNALKPPVTFICQEGWTRYREDCEPEKVPYPDEDTLVFDVEVCLSVGQAPTVATALSPNAWYAWVSPDLLSSGDPIAVRHYTPCMFIPLEGRSVDKKKKRLVIGHNVSYDRARIKEQYRLENSALRFLDTMSMHVAIGGVTSFQRAMLKAKVGAEDSDWREYSSLNSLKAVHSFYCKEELNKDTRDLFVEGKLSDIRDNFQEVMSYCSQDVIATFKVLQKMTPMFFERFPHPVTLAGMLEMGSMYLPINSNWERYITDTEQTYEDMEMECKFLLARKSDNACQLMHDDKFKNDLWMWDEDWSTQELKMTKKKTPKVEENQSEERETDDEKDERELEDRFRDLLNSSVKLPVKRPHLPGYPKWYRKLCEKPGDPDWVPGPRLISTSVKVTPKLLNLTWEKYPLHYTREHGWGILVADLNVECDERQVPYEKFKQLTLKNEKNGTSVEFESVYVEDLKNKVDYHNSKEDNYGKPTEKTVFKSGGVLCGHIVDGCCHFLKLPHKDGSGMNVGNPLSKDFTKTFSGSTLAGTDEVAQKVLDIGRMLSYWRNNKERICGQLAVWHGVGQGVILPQVVVCGTLTRRAMEPTWMTASNAQKDRIGSELRSMVQSPPGYHFVGADVDSEELWIAAIIGDAAAYGIHGGTPFGWMTLSGNKASGTDMHSVTASATGISREHAKVINYARIYGAGVRFAQRLLQQFNPQMSDTEAKSKANKMFLLTKGQKVFKLKSEFRDQLPGDVGDNHSAFSAKRIAKILGKSIEEVFKQPRWEGGTESAMFNRLEEIALSREPRTSFLSARLSRAVEPRREGDDSFLTTRVNWVVQSGATDFLHLMLVCMRWLTQGKIRFCLSFHDEVRYLVPSNLRYEAALALHITNLLTRSFCARRLGLHDLPQSVAFFSSIDVDKVLRKETKDDCRTPSNIHGLERGYNIPPGESLDIQACLQKCDRLHVFKPPKKPR